MSLGEKVVPTHKKVYSTNYSTSSHGNIRRELNNIIVNLLDWSDSISFVVFYPFPAVLLF